MPLVMRGEAVFVFLLLEFVDRYFAQELFELVKVHALPVGLYCSMEGLGHLLPLGKLWANFKVLQDVLQVLGLEYALPVSILLGIGAKELLDSAIVPWIVGRCHAPWSLEHTRRATEEGSRRASRASELRRATAARCKPRRLGPAYLCRVAADRVPGDGTYVALFCLLKLSANSVCPTRAPTVGTWFVLCTRQAGGGRAGTRARVARRGAPTFSFPQPPFCLPLACVQRPCSWNRFPANRAKTPHLGSWGASGAFENLKLLVVEVEVEEEEEEEEEERV